MNKYQFKTPTPTGLGTSYYYCYGDNSFENYLNIKNIKYKKLEETDESGKNIFNEKDKEIERLNNIINELEKYIKTDAKIELYKDISGFRTFVDGQDLLNKLQELKGEDKDA